MRLLGAEWLAREALRALSASAHRVRLNKENHKMRLLPLAACGCRGLRRLFVATSIVTLALIGKLVGADPVCGGSSLNFGPALNYGADSGSEDVVVGDFNRDDVPDLAVVNEDLTSNDVSILINQGDGTFQPPLNLGVGVNPVSLAVDDFNIDGRLDLAVANFSNPAATSLSILLGNGDGTFRAAVGYNAGENAHSVAVGDFDGDQKLDLAVANYDRDSVSVLLGNGDGTFRAPFAYGVGRTAAYLAKGDFNGDLKLDLAVANLDSSNVSVLLGRGDGTFQAALSYPTGARPYGIAAGDLDGDLQLDLVTANLSGNSVSVLRGNGDGSFRLPIDYAVGLNPGAVAVGRLDVDGTPDIVATNFNGHTVSTLLGNGDGTFQPAVAFPTDFFPSGVAARDLNGDGKIDVAASTFTGTVTVLLNQSRPGSLLDSFNRPDGELGSLWFGKTKGYSIVDQRMDVGSGLPIYWSPNLFGVDQEACVSFVAVDPDGPRQSLVLKVQDDDWRNGAVIVSYDARRRGIYVGTYEPGVGGTLRASFDSSLGVGDQLGGRVMNDGTVQAFVNGVLVGETSAGSFFVGKGGRVGLGFAGADGAMLEDFAGGTLTP